MVSANIQEYLMKSRFLSQPAPLLRAKQAGGAVKMPSVSMLYEHFSEKPQNPILQEYM